MTIMALSIEEWKCYGKYGWQLKMLLKKRNLLFLIPFDGWFRIAFFYGDREVKAAEESDIPQEIITELQNARKYMEGRGVRVDVKKKADATVIQKMLKIKIEN